MHDAVLGRAKEVGRAAEAVEHSRAHDVSAVCMGIDVDLDGRVHAYTHEQKAQRDPRTTYR